VSSVTVIVLPDWTDSSVVAVMLIVPPALYVPSLVVDENDETVGAVRSRVTLTVDVTALIGPVVELPLTLLALRRGMTVPTLSPLKQDDAVSVYTFVETDVTA
jgi:hypothetical protein